jgi:hypothetical protein
VTSNTGNVEGLKALDLKPPNREEKCPYDGHRIGAVCEVLSHVLFLDTGSCPDPKVSVSMRWIADIDQAIELAKSREQAEQEWRDHSTA